MINQITKNKITELSKTYQQLAKGNENVLREIALAEIPEMVYNSNAIENSTLTLKDTEKIIIEGKIGKGLDTREVFEAKNLAAITKILTEDTKSPLTVASILNSHKILLTHINDKIAGRFRTGKEWVSVGNHIGANPLFVNELMIELVEKYNNDRDTYFLDKIAHFHAELETIHPFNDGNGRIGRMIINQQLALLDLPPIIIQNKSKHTDYYPLFDAYVSTMKYDGFTALFALLLIESLNKRIAYLTAKRIVPLTKWAEQNNVKGNIAANKAKRQTIPAFRLREKWVINETFRENE
ncbi:MAG: Fic family protein [Bacteroidales bacterium]|jgi:Fic family protein|nr:Fic family protein [Bacteroidales bacterium]